MTNSAAVAAGLSGHATATSEYIYRGNAVSDNEPALQFGIDYEFENGFFAGLWASTIDLESPFSQRDREFDLYVGYHFPASSRVSLTGTVMRYTYPGQRGFDYDYSEASVTATLNDRHSLEFGYTDDLYGRGGVGRYWQARTERPFVGAWVLSAGLGYNDFTAYNGRRYLYWDAGASARVYRLTFDLRWHDNEPSGIGIAGSSAGSRLVASLSVVF